MTAALLLSAALSAATPRPTATPTRAVDCKALGRAELDLYARAEQTYVAAFGEHGAAADRDFNEATALSDAAATKHGEYVRCQHRGATTKKAGG